MGKRNLYIGVLIGSKIDLASLELLKTDSSWLGQANSEPIIMVSPFHEFLTDMMGKDKKGFFRLGVSHVDAYKQIWGEPAFIFDGKYPWKTWIFKLGEGGHLVLYSDKDGGTSFEYAGPRMPSPEAFDKAVSILNAIKDDVHVRKEPDVEFGM